jgi:glutamine cyclotransferase
METKIIKCLFIAGLMALSFLYSCNPTGEKHENRQQDTATKNSLLTLLLDSPANGSLFSLGDVVPVHFSNYSISPDDTILLSINNSKFKDYTNNEHGFMIKTDSLCVGHNQINIEIHSKKVYFGSVQIIFKAPKPPVEYGYKIVARFPHDDKSYTQGLEFYKGIMYEGSGQLGESALRKYKLETNELLQSYSIPSNVFGEGITIYKDKIYQLTWQSHIAYEYELSTFKLIRTFEYNTEGWGITTVNDFLVMSDGSNTLYFINPETFTEAKHLEVYNNVGPVQYLNELEYIDGLIYANVYQTDDVVIINPKNGIVEGIIHFTNLLDKSKVKKDPDVLNGIAYDHDKKRLFVTGKYWPETYQVKIFKK